MKRKAKNNKKKHRNCWLNESHKCLMEENCLTLNKIGIKTTIERELEKKLCFSGEKPNLYCK